MSTVTNTCEGLRGGAIVGEVFTKPLLDQHSEGGGGKTEDEADKPEEIDEKHGCVRFEDWVERKGSGLERGVDK